MDKNEKASGQNIPAGNSRRKFLLKTAWSGIAAFFLASAAAFARFFFPRVLFEPPARVKVGKPSEFLPSTVDTSLRIQFGVILLVWAVIHTGCSSSEIDELASERPIH